jgi:hypothetical protein
MAISTWAQGVRLCVVLVALSAWPSLSAASSCAASFKELKAEDGATFYVALSTHQAMDAQQVLDGYRKAAMDEGYVIVAQPDYSAATPVMGIGKLPSPNPVMLMFDRQTSSISLNTIVPPGNRADAAEERTRLCGLVAAFQDRQSGTGNGRGSTQTAAEQQQRNRTTIPEAVPSLRLLSPSVSFDPLVAKAALEPGRSVIRGQACGSHQGAIAYASGSQVLLYPATPYWEQLVQMTKKAKSGRDQVVPEPEALATRMEATANTRGEFQFSQMKPGRYFLVTTLSAVLGGSRDVHVGRVQGTYSSADVYAAESYTFDASNELSEFVEIRRDGDVVKVTLQPPISANPFRRGLRGSLLGCHGLP